MYSGPMNRPDACFQKAPPPLRRHATPLAHTTLPPSHPRSGSARRSLARDVARLRHRELAPVVAALMLAWWVAAFAYYGLVMLSAELSALQGGGGRHPQARSTLALGQQGG